ncbi:LysE family translocator [Mycobacterium sp. 3519A]|uniref:LysE family translocator n=1 Tax=Mycobacterium sp. 3519A TaxID=2057184 RepID=UPI000C7A288F|nr:LysE family transporter [Mycobacterium sp. 3519A]
MNSDVLSLITIAGAIVIGAISPGPSFVMVAQTSLSKTPRSGRIAALGIAAGGLVFAVAATVGLGATLAYAGPVFLAIKIAGGAYLVYLGIRLWLSTRGQRSAAEPIAVPTSRTFATALLTQLSNPKAIIVYGSVFASALPLHPSHWLLITLPVAVTCIEGCWYLIVATVMSRPGPRGVYAHAGKLLDRTAGTVMGGLGTAFAVDGLRAALR